METAEGGGIHGFVEGRGRLRHRIVFGGSRAGVIRVMSLLIKKRFLVLVSCFSLRSCSVLVVF